MNILDSESKIGTPFSEIYNRFLGKITDDMYVELTPEDTIKDLRNMLIDAIPNFEFPDHNLYEFTIQQKEKFEDEVVSTDFIIGLLWDELDEKDDDKPPKVVIEQSYFSASLSSEEINILAILMMVNWVQRQVTSIENTRMKYSGSDFKMTSQANHLQKLLSLLNEVHRQSHHMQRLYHRRKFGKNSGYKSNWSVLREKSALRW